MSASKYAREWKLSFTLATLARWGLAAVLVVIAFIAFADDPEPTEVRWRDGRNHSRDLGGALSAGNDPAG